MQIDALIAQSATTASTEGFVRRKAISGLVLAMASAALLGLSGCSSKKESIKEQLGQLGASLDELNSKIEELGSHVESFRDGVTSWRDIVDDLESAYDDLKHTFDEVEANYTNLQANIGED